MKRSILYLLFIGFIGLPGILQAQTAGDTLRIGLPEFIVKAQKDPDYEYKFQLLKRRVKKALPYAKLAAFRYQMLEQNLQMLPTERSRKAYLKQTEAAIKDQFMDDLKNLSVNEGKILIKLIYRETGRNAYDLVKSYRGDFTALYWQGIAKVFGGNLKSEYDPIEDWQIEQIIHSMGFE